MSVMSSLKRQLTKKLNPGSPDTRRVITDAVHKARAVVETPEFIRQRERRAQREREYGQALAWLNKQTEENHRSEMASTADYPLVVCVSGSR